MKALKGAGPLSDHSSLCSGRDFTLVSRTSNRVCTRKSSVTKGKKGKPLTEQGNLVDETYTSVPEVSITVTAGCKGDGTGYWSATIEEEGRSYVLIGEGSNTTSHEMGLIATREALKRLEPSSRITLYCNNEYIINGCVAFSRGFQAHRELWKEIHKLLEDKELEAVKT